MTAKDLRRRQRISVKTFVSNSREETIALGERIGAAAPSGSVIAFRGGLGAGKTTLSKGIAAGLAIDEEISSHLHNHCGVPRSPAAAPHGCLQITGRRGL